MTHNKERFKSCSRCKQPFICSPSDCWCSDYTLTAPTLHFLAQRYENCLCPTCLSDYGTKAAESFGTRKK